MVDLHRAYRRWALRRFLLLAPSLALSVAANLWIALGVDGGPWLKIVSLSISLLCAVLLGYLLLQSQACARLQERGERKLARIARSALAPYRGVALVCLAVLGVLLLAPAVFRPSPPSASLGPVVRSARPPLAPIGPGEPFTQVPPAAPAPEPAGEPALAAAERPGELPPAAPPVPQIHPHLAEVPLRMTLEDWDPGPEAARETASLPQEPPPAPPSLGDPDLPPSRPEGNPFARRLPTSEAPGVDRPGLPDEDDSLGPPPSARFEAMLLRLDDRSRGAGSAITLDLPFSPHDSFRARYFLAVLSHDDPFPEADPEFTWHRFTLEYSRRLTGYTRRAALDLAVSAGFSGDGVDSDLSGASVDGTPRLSPHVGLDLGVWQGGSWGMILRVGQSLPLNATGASSAVTDVAATLEVGLSERLSLSLGYRYLLVRFREHSSPFQARHARDELESSLGGPLLGLEARF
jgi:hypothetical protein